MGNTQGGRMNRQRKIFHHTPTGQRKADLMHTSTLYLMGAQSGFSFFLKKKMYVRINSNCERGRSLMTNALFVGSA